MADNDMALNARYEVRDGYLYVEVSGDFDHSEAHGLLHECVAEARRHDLTRVLCDITSITGLEPDAASFWDYVEISQFTAHALPKDLQVAILETPQQMIGGRVAEDVMVQRGAQVRVTSDRQDALEWLGVPVDPDTDSANDQDSGTSVADAGTPPLPAAFKS